MTTMDDVLQALRWLHSMEVSARTRGQKNHEADAKNAQKVIRELANIKKGAK